jgi:hypothetical protein
LPSYHERYTFRYPLREWGLDRAACGRIITAAGLPLPPKSACFFCPSMKPAEIDTLADDHPDYFRLALEMERLYRGGKHFRGDGLYTVRAKHKVTGEKHEVTFKGVSEADARDQFRRAYDDTAKPYRYAVSVSQSVVGLGRHHTWAGRVTLPVVAA